MRGFAVPHVLLGDAQAVVSDAVDRLDQERVVARIWDGDPEVWGGRPDTPELSDRLGWLTCIDPMLSQVGSLEAFAAGVDAQRLVLLGMGGSSLAPEVMRAVLAGSSDHPEFIMLDSTAPAAVRAVQNGAADSLYIVSSKSGTTLETLTLFRHFWQVSGERGSQFVAITDPGSPLETLATDRGFRATFTGDPTVGGRFSALSPFGIVPAALMGIDVPDFLERAASMAAACRDDRPGKNPALVLGATMGSLALRGCNKLTLLLPPEWEVFGLWLEQLIAESTGKDGRGIVPVVQNDLDEPDGYGRDRLIVGVSAGGRRDEGRERYLEGRSVRGHPVIRLDVADARDLGAEFFRWEFATAVAAAVMRVNPFDQPNVAESKRATAQVLEAGTWTDPAHADDEEIDAFLDGLAPGDYVALLAYAAPWPELDDKLRLLATAIRRRFLVAVTVGYGPRYLHSTGQLHKGGPPTGHFIQFVESSPDVRVAEEDVTFDRVLRAQAAGDWQALAQRGRPIIRVADPAALRRRLEPA
jgi:glucose-6-phosphate isomerase